MKAISITVKLESGQIRGGGLGWVGWEGRRDPREAGQRKTMMASLLGLQLSQCSQPTLLPGFQPRRSLLFISWDGGDFGSVGSTEWLEVT